MENKTITIETIKEIMEKNGFKNESDLISYFWNIDFSKPETIDYKSLTRDEFNLLYKYNTIMSTLMLHEYTYFEDFDDIMEKILTNNDVIVVSQPLTKIPHKIDDNFDYVNYLDSVLNEKSPYYYLCDIGMTTMCSVEQFINLLDEKIILYSFYQNTNDFSVNRVNDKYFVRYKKLDDLVNDNTEINTIDGTVIKGIVNKLKSVDIIGKHLTYFLLCDDIDKIRNLSLALEACSLIMLENEEKYEKIKDIIFPIITRIYNEKDVDLEYLTVESIFYDILNILNKCNNKLNGYIEYSKDETYLTKPEQQKDFMFSFIEQYYFEKYNKE